MFLYDGEEPAPYFVIPYRLQITSRSKFPTYVETADKEQEDTHADVGYRLSQTA